MNRSLRIEYPGAFYHVHSRGVDKRKIYEDEQDCVFFLQLCNKLAKSLNFTVHSYCLMGNHYHFYIETPLGNLSQIMHQLNSKYAMYFNKKYARSGKLFQGRYKAHLVDSNNYSFELSRYIHLNPIRAKLVENLHEWQWSSYPAYLGLCDPELFLDINWTLHKFSSDLSEAVAKHHQFTLEGLRGKWLPGKDIAYKSILGNQKFVDIIKKSFIQENLNPGISGIIELKKYDYVNKLKAKVENLDADKKTKKKLLMYLMRHKTHLSLSEIGKELGGMKADAVRKSLGRLKLSNLLKLLS